jgi:hypothetical protein
MDSRLTDREATIFAQAIEFASVDDRRRFLDQACGDDADLRAKVDYLVRHHFEAGSFLENPADLLPTLSVPPPPEVPGTVIGPYKLLEQIGEGGMGVVYMAEQQKPEEAAHWRKALQQRQQSKTKQVNN